MSDTAQSQSQPAPTIVAPPSDPSPDTNSKPTATTKPAKAAAKPAAAPTPTAASLLAPRHIPGAPPPEPPKEKKKRSKRKPASSPGNTKAESLAGDDSPAVDAHNAALIDTAPPASQVAGELVATQEEIQKEVVEPEEDDHETGLDEDLPRWKVFKKSAAVETIGNKIKKLQTRLERAQAKPTKPEGTLAKLGLEQKPLTETPAFIEAVIQEFKELKTSVEDEEGKRREKEEATLKEFRLTDRKEQKLALREKLAATEAQGLHKVDIILSFVALATVLSSPSPSRPFTIPVADAERVAVAKAFALLLESETRGDIVTGLLDENDTGDIDGTPYARLRALTKSFGHPISPISSPAPNDDEVRRPLQGYPNGVQSMSFMNDSELDGPPAPLTFGSGVALEDVHGVPAFDPDETLAASNLDSSAELIDGNDAIPSASAVQQEWVEVKAETEAEPAAKLPTTDTFDWAADDLDHELPSLDTLHAKFGTSGNVTPTTAPTPPVGEPPVPLQISTTAGPKAEDDGWITTPVRGGRTRTVSSATERGGRGRGDYRGARGGTGSGFRGGPPRGGGSGFRGGPRGGGGGGSPQMSGGEGGEEGSPGGWRGRGGYRGGDRGGTRGRGEGGDWRGAGGQDGDRPRGRGNYRGRQFPQTPTAA